MPAVSVLTMRPELVRLAPGSAAALARYPSPAFFSAAATVAAREVRSSWIWVMYWRGSTFGFPATPSASPAFTSSTSAGVSAKGPSRSLSETPMA